MIKKIITKTSIYSFQIKHCGRPFGEISRDGRLTWLLILLLFHRLLCLTSESSYSRPLGYIPLLCKTIMWSGIYSFHRLSDPLPLGHHMLEQRREYVPSTTWQVFLALLMLQFLCPSNSFLLIFTRKCPCLYENFNYLKLQKFHQILWLIMNLKTLFISK